MRKSGFKTIYTARSSADADRIIGVLRNAGLHPVDLSLSAPLALPGNHTTFPVQVPIEEADAAEQLLKFEVDVDKAA